MTQLRLYYGSIEAVLRRARVFVRVLLHFSKGNARVKRGRREEEEKEEEKKEEEEEHGEGQLCVCGRGQLLDFTQHSNVDFDFVTFMAPLRHHLLTLKPLTFFFSSL